MPTLNFPTTPSVDQQYSFGGKTWIWTGQAWRLYPQGAINDITIGNITPAAGTFTNLSATGSITATGNISGNYFIGNGSQLTGVTADSGGFPITAGSSNIAAPVADGNISVTVSGVGNVAVFTTDGLTVSSNITASGNITADAFVGSGADLTNVMADRGVAPNNWNTMTQMGVYTVNRVSWSGTVGTPLDSQVYVGLVEVKNSTNVALTQIFYPGTVETGNVKMQWNRTYWSGSWSDWIKIVNDDQVISGGTF